jgi:hypothetical protein
MEIKKAGRPKIDDCRKKIPLRVMVEGCVIENWGNLSRAQNCVIDFLNRGPDELPKKRKKKPNQSNP